MGRHQPIQTVASAICVVTGIFFTILFMKHFYCIRHNWLPEMRPTKCQKIAAILCCISLSITRSGHVFVEVYDYLNKPIPTTYPLYHEVIWYISNVVNGFAVTFFRIFITIQIYIRFTKCYKYITSKLYYILVALLIAIYAVAYSVWRYPPFVYRLLSVPNPDVYGERFFIIIGYVIVGSATAIDTILFLTHIVSLHRYCREFWSYSNSPIDHIDTNSRMHEQLLVISRLTLVFTIYTLIYLIWAVLYFINDYLYPDDVAFTTVVYLLEDFISVSATFALYFSLEFSYTAYRCLCGKCHDWVYDSCRNWTENKELTRRLVTASDTDEVRIIAIAK
eukprot:CAMPEP_0197037212 /NCGR_PEP_ID=MMETSP1384-20130603/14476_1 /TAXON_ID=29189 /ORGANISM="Ammonia sp." /LENGTH=334 /DNA_ID=CAMNT_0042467481 /DNA_START=35 /DNA_END=1039 /DNA_ORIENTATION=-